MARVEPGSEGDPDGDGVPENFDNCPGYDNPDQADLDRIVVIDSRGISEFGDVCDYDLDGDGMANTEDDQPRDTDNDGSDNEEDSDDDGDEVPDDEDSCPLIANPDQIDTDGDGGADACDGDKDDDDFRDAAEQIAASDPLDASSRPEFLGLDDVCGDAQDNDKDGDFDADDNGCTDSDRDQFPDYLDNCPDDENPDQLDWNDDGDGNECDSDDDGDAVPDLDDECSEPEPQRPGEVDAKGC